MTSVYPIPFDQFEGIYEVPDVAKYIYAADRTKYEAADNASGRDSHADYRVTSRHLIRWIRKGLALDELKDIPGRELVITFEDLVFYACNRSSAIAWREFPD